VQPVFNRDVIAGLSDSAVSSLLELEAWINGEEFIGAREAQDDANVSTQIAGSQMTLTNIESEMIQAVGHHITTAAVDLVNQLAKYPPEEGRKTITTVFLRSISDGPIELLRYLLDTGLVDTSQPDEITDYSCLHEAAIAGRLDILQLCIYHGTSFLLTTNESKVPTFSRSISMGDLLYITLAETVTKP
jgi:CDK inhibitor PHO81